MIVSTRLCSPYASLHPPSQCVRVTSPFQSIWEIETSSCLRKGDEGGMRAAWAARVKMASSTGRRSQIAVAGAVISFCCITRHE